MQKGKTKKQANGRRIEKNEVMRLSVYMWVSHGTWKSDEKNKQWETELSKEKKKEKQKCLPRQRISQLKYLHNISFLHLHVLRHLISCFNLFFPWLDIVFEFFYLLYLPRCYYFLTISLYAHSSTVNPHFLHNDKRVQNLQCSSFWFLSTGALLLHAHPFFFLHIQCEWLSSASIQSSRNNSTFC